MEFVSGQSFCYCETETVAARVQTILRRLQAALGAWGLEAVLGLLLYRRISLVACRIEGLMRRFRAGRLGGRKAGRGPALQVNGGRMAGRGPAMPWRTGWLLKAGRHHAALFHLQLLEVVSTPEMADLLAASPQAMRLLRPLCRALAVQMPGRIAAVRDQAVLKPRKPRPKVVREPFRIPLPRGVISAARRQGFGKAW